MSTANEGWKNGWKVGLRVWIERDGHAILGRGRLELLQTIGQSRSISEAARQMGMSYRRAWLLVQSINQAAGVPLVTAATGGKHGGGAFLTSQGQAAIEVFRELQDDVHYKAATLLRRILKTPNSTTIHVAAAISLEDVLNQLLTDFTLKEPTIRVRTIFGASDELAELIVSGAAVDLFISADPVHIDHLESQGIAARAWRTVLAENSLTVIGSRSLAAIVHKAGDLKRAEVQRIALADSSTPLGRYAQTYLETRGLLEALLPKAIKAENAGAVVTAIRSGQAQAGFVYGSDAIRAKECITLFQVRRHSTPIRYVASATVKGHTKKEVKALLEFLSSHSAAFRFRLCGFHSVQNRTKP